MKMQVTKRLLSLLLAVALLAGFAVPLRAAGGDDVAFTIAPNKAYMIRNGKLAEPVRISVVTGSVMHTLHEIDGLTKDVKVCSLSTGGCGKMEQWPLRVAFGGPYVRVRNIQVQ